ncbi:MAG: WYL domain-containing protein [Myxococcaceae bacterium]|nr:WYL domain-containing protein [Myxococcaceae bacterium]
MERTERLLDLVALLLDSKEPVSWNELRETFKDDYGVGSTEACERKFERDKAELLELGIPLTFVKGDDERPDGYLVERDAYYLPEVSLTPEELAVLYAAGSAALASGAFPGSQDLAHALRKIGFFSGGPPPAPKVRLELGGVADTRDLPARLDALWSAISSRKSVTLDYWSPRTKEHSHRVVDGYGLALRRGLWTLVGYCHLRQGIRTFHVHRMRKVTVNTAKPRSPDYEVPASFSLDEYVATWPWQHRFHEPLRVDVLLTGELSPLAGTLFPSTPADDPRGSRVTVQATDLDGLVKYVLSLGPAAKVLGPARAVERHHELARAVLAAHPTVKEAP